MTALARADATAIPLRDGSVDLIVTSPPYFALRSYTDGGEHYDGQIGSEPTPGDFLVALWTVLDECWRVLKPGGSCWVNLGDKYAAGHGGSSTEGKGVTIRKRAHTAAVAKERPDLPNPPASWGKRDASPRHVIPDDARPKSLMGLPWRFALGLTCPDPYRTCYQPGDHPQWVLRAEVVWSKPNGLPESVTDRVRRSHEQWFHLTKQGRYFAAVDEVREPHTGNDAKSSPAVTNERSGETHRVMRRDPDLFNPLGKLPGSVWTIPSEPLKVPEHLGVDHFAAYPQEWPRRIILGWSPSGICVECGEGRRPVVAKELRELHRQTRNRGLTDDGGRGSRSLGIGSDLVVGENAATITGYSCACPTPNAPTRPAVVLDPFAGTGTTVMVARALGRTGVGLDLSADYLRLARWRVFESGHAAKTVERTNRERQTSLFGDVA